MLKLALKFDVWSDLILLKQNDHWSLRYKWFDLAQTKWSLTLIEHIWIILTLTDKQAESLID